MGNLTHIITDVDVWSSAEAHVRDILLEFPGFHLKSECGLDVSYEGSPNSGWVWWNTTEQAPMYGYVGDCQDPKCTGDPECADYCGTCAEEFEILHGIHSGHPRPGFTWMYWVQSSITTELCERWKAHNPRLFDEGVGVIPIRPRRTLDQYLRDWWTDPSGVVDQHTLDWNREMNWEEFLEMAPKALVAQESR